MKSSAFFIDRVVRDAAEVAHALVEGGIAPDAAVAWAARTERGWEVGGGRAGRGGDPGFEPIFDLASLTKPMTAVAVARSGVDRTVPLGELLEEGRDSASASIPLELLLAHRAGLEAHLPLHEKLLLVEECVDRATALRVVADARRPECAFALPDDGFPPVYSDLGYILAGEVLARSVGAADAGDAIQRLVIEPLGAVELGTARSLSGRDAAAFEQRVRPTEIVPWRGGEICGVVHDENAWALGGTGGSGHAGMFGTAPAVRAFGQAVLDALEHGEGPFAGADLEWLVRRRPGGSLRAGFDTRAMEGPSSLGRLGGPRTFGHLGFTGTSLWIDPDAGAVIVVLTNRVHPTRDNLAIRAARPLAHDALFALATAGQRVVVAERSA